MTPILAVFPALALTCLLSFIFTDYLSQKFKKIGITGIDIHKPSKPVTAEMGGLAVLIGVAAGASVYYVIARNLPFVFLACLLTILLVGIVGVADDLFALKQRYKPFIVAAASAPLSLALLGHSVVKFPLIGSVPFGILFPLIVVPLGITISANLTNMLAGFNGLETGCGLLGIGALTLLCYLTGQQEAAILGSLFVAGYLGFFVLNWYPAKIFPGDTGTLMAGAAIAAIGLISGFEFAAIVVSIPAAFDFTLKFLTKNPFSARAVHGNTIVTSDGVLKPPKYPALSHAFMRAGAISERSLVISMLGMEAVYAALAVIITISM